MNTTSLTHRLAQTPDQHAITDLIRAAIDVNMRAFMSQAEIRVAQESMGLDTSLIEDQTYFVIETCHHNETVMVGCGGWGKRRTLYGGNHSAGRDDRFSDPAHQPARIRAMYTHPDWTRKGIGSLLLDLGENAARAAGFKTIELGSTLPGEPLYRAHGYVEFDRDVHIAENGETENRVENIIIHMRKTL